MKTSVAASEEILQQAASAVAAVLAAKPDAVLTLGANDECLRLYRLLAGRCDLSRARFVALTEFEGLSADDPRSCRERLREALLRDADPTGERSIFLSPENLDELDGELAEAGGLDLVILGVGERGRIGFNEPATPFDSAPHRQKLTRATKRELASLFGGEEPVPDYGLTLGIKTITEARQIFVLALGELRADPVFRMLYARTDSFVPAAFLQLPPKVSVYLDEAAAQRLSE